MELNVERIPPDVHIDDSGKMTWTPRLVDYLSAKYTAGYTIKAEDFNTEFLKTVYQGNYNTDTLTILIGLYNNLNDNVNATAAGAVTEANNALNISTDALSIAETANEKADEAVNTATEALNTVNDTLSNVVFLTGAQTITGTKTFTGQVTAASFNSTSDKRLKTNIKSYSCPKSILDLPIKEFDYIDSGIHTIGCIAQDLQKICPEIVTKRPDGYLSIQESKLVYLILQELKVIKQELNKLKGE